MIITNTDKMRKTMLCDWWLYEGYYNVLAVLLCPSPPLQKTNHKLMLAARLSTLSELLKHTHRA